LAKLVETTFAEVRGSTEAELQRTSEEQNKLRIAVSEVQKVMDALPPEVALCQSACRTAEHQCRQLAEKVDEAIKKNYAIEAEKFGIKDHHKYAQKVESAILTVEKALDKVEGRTEELQNWIDIYLPLRL